MALQRLPLLLLLLLLSLSLFPSLSQAFTFSVGGKDGWVLHPSEDYDHWGGRNRFQVNDVLYFKYKKGDDSVLVVNKDDYSNCNTENPVLKLDGGDSRFTFTRSGPFYFISGVKDHCLNGQKLTLVVLAMRHPRSQPASHPPSTSPSHARAAAASPTLTPAAAPGPHAIVPSTSPTASSPRGASSPTAASPSPSLGPGASPTPLASGPVLSPASSGPHGGHGAAPSSPEQSPPADVKAPSPTGSAAPPISASFFAMMPVTLALSLMMHPSWF